MTLRVKSHLLAWLGVTALWCVYLGVHEFASHEHAVALKLEPGFVSELSSFRLASHRPVMGLQFKRQPGQRRPELGDGFASEKANKPGYVRYPAPGAPVKLLISIQDAEPTIYEALPASAFSDGDISRKLTSHLAITPGVWPDQTLSWPHEDSEGLTLLRGVNRLKIQVSSVGPELAGEVVELFIQPLLQFKTCHPAVCWLNFAFWFTPVVLVIQVLWLLAIVISALRRKRTAA